MEFEIIQQAVYILMASGMTGAVTFLLGIRKANAKLCKEISRQRQDIEQIKKVLIIKAKMIDEQTQRAHPDAVQELEEMVRIMLNGKEE